VKVCDSQSPCPCGRQGAQSSALPYDACCGRWLETDAPAPDAEHLMRSRYSAFVLEREAYLRATWHPTKRPSQVTFDEDAKWLGLEIKDHRIVDAGHAEVEFVARQRLPGGRAVRLHERSRFVQEEGRWLYVDGVHDPK